MTSLARLLTALRCGEVDRPPWVPFVGCHAATLLGITADEYLRNEEHLVAGVQAAIDRYRPDGMPVVFDLQLEAEALGCQLNWDEKNPPSVVSHPLVDGRAIDDFQMPMAHEGRIGMALSATSRLRRSNPDIGLYGLVTGPFTLALHLLGTDIFMKMFDQAEYVHRVLAFCKEVGITLARYYVKAGCDVIALVDPMTSQIGPEQFTEYVLPVAKPVFDDIRRQGKLSSFFVCGHAQQNVEVMCRCGPDNVSVDENIPLQYVRDVCIEKGISFGGNLQLTSVLLLGSRMDSQRNALACMEIGGTHGFVLSPGCDLPFDTPPENLEAVYELVSDPYQQDVVRSAGREMKEGDRLDLREYGERDKIIVDIITLDSEACAPCHYMVGAVKQVAPEFEGIVEWREHKIKYRESLVFMTSLMVRNVPTICIDGKIKFISRIPPRDELIAAIQQRINEKFRSQLLARGGQVLVLGSADEQTEETVRQVERAIAELGMIVQVQAVHDDETIASYGLTKGQCPAVVVVRHRVKSIGHVPNVAAVKEWMKDLR
ncbi:MAG: uroporphyrinogen decarboxylase family protein [Pirellulaceae bacterium]